MNALLIALAVHAAAADARVFAQCAKVSRRVGICHEGRGGLIFVNGGYSTRIGFDGARRSGGAVCQPGTRDTCQWASAIVEHRPAWPVAETELVGTYRYCLTRRPVKGHLPIGCLTRATDLSFRRMDLDSGFVP